MNVMINGKSRLVVVMTIKKEWFDKLLSGEKTIEYREYKSYWTKRLNMYGIICNVDHNCIISHHRYILFVNGYRKDSRQAIAEVEKIYTYESGIDTDLKVNKSVMAIYIKQIRELNRNDMEERWK